MVRPRSAQQCLRGQAVTPGCLSCPRSKPSGASSNPSFADAGSLAFTLVPDAGRLLRGRSANEIHAELSGRTVTGVRRRGKYLGLELDDDRRCVVHLRMTGSLRFRSQAYPAERFTRASFELDRGDELRFVDVRKFGTIDVVDQMADALPELGPEPLSDDFTVESLWHALRGRHQPDQGRPCSTSATSPASATSTPTRRCLSHACTPKRRPARCGRRNAACSTPPSVRFWRKVSATAARHSATTPTSTAKKASSSTTSASSAAPTSPATSAPPPSAER